VVLARLLAEQGFSTVLVDLTESGLPTRLMARHERLVGLSDLLVGRINVAESIHGDRLSAAHIVPRGVSDQASAVRSAERLPMILDGLRDAYQMLLVECGPRNAADTGKLVRKETEHEIIISAVEPGVDAIAEALADFYGAGYAHLIVMMPGTASSAEGDGSYAA
jgi:Mrp family chromosome partitioning ATPase